MKLTPQMLESLGGDQVESYQAFETIEAEAWQATAPGQSARRAELARFLAAELNATDPGGKDDKGNDKPPVPRYGMRVRNQVARLLGIVATDAEVPALAAALDPFDLRESARCALDRVASPNSTDVLIAALGQVGPAFRVGVVGSLARRSGENVTRALRSLANDPDAEVRLAAADALAGMPDAANDEMLSTMSKSACRCTRSAANKARIRLAETLSRAGDTTAARRIYHSVLHSEADEPQKDAAKAALEAMRK